MSNKQARISDYWNSDLEEKDVDFMEDSTATSSGEKPGNKRKGIEKENKNPMKKKAGGKIDGLTLTQHKRMLGDQVKSKLEIAGGKYDWHIKARCHLTTSLSREAFKAVVVPHVDSVTPAKFDDNTEVFGQDEDYSYLQLHSGCAGRSKRHESGICHFWVD